MIRNLKEIFYHEIMIQFKKPSIQAQARLVGVMGLLTGITGCHGRNALKNERLPPVPSDELIILRDDGPSPGMIELTGKKKTSIIELLRVLSKDSSFPAAFLDFKHPLRIYHESPPESERDTSGDYPSGLFYVQNSKHSSSFSFSIAPVAGMQGLYSIFAEEENGDALLIKI